MTRNSVVAVLLIALTFAMTVLKAQSYDDVGSGRALQFDGVDDYIDLGDRYDDLTLPLTISAWVNVSPDMTYAFPIFNSQDNLSLYNGVTFAVSPLAFSIQYGDGMGEDNPAFRRGKSATIPNIAGRWVNLTAIMRGATDMDLFLNGVNIGGQYSGSSDLPMASMFPADHAKIGAWFSNGITTYFEGQIDELRIYNRTLSETEIREQMCKKLLGTESGLIGYWTFDETNGNLLKDKSPNHFDGQLIGNPTRVFSGAPIGNKSLYLYTTSWPGKSLKLDDLEVINVQGNPQGIHIYKVGDAPSQTSGLDVANTINSYYGVFIASMDVGNSFGLNGSPDLTCKSYKRNDNSDGLWTELNSYTSLLERKEIIISLEGLQEISLGPDQILCDQSNFALVSNIDLTGKTILWSTGETTSSISVGESGEYTVEVFSSCKVDRDTVSVTFLETPALFSLGKDEEVCTLNARILKPYADIEGFDFEWQDGSKDDSFEIKDFGKYWLTIKNSCGSVSDTLKISRRTLVLNNLPNIITPNGDAFNQHFIVGDEIGLCRLFIYNRWGDMVFQSPDYKNNWDAPDLSSGIYYYRLRGDCIKEVKGSITISR